MGMIIKIKDVLNSTLFCYITNSNPIALNITFFVDVLYFEIREFETLMIIHNAIGCSLSLLGGFIVSDPFY